MPAVVVLDRLWASWAAAVDQVFVRSVVQADNFFAGLNSGVDEMSWSFVLGLLGFFAGARLLVHRHAAAPRAT